MSDTRPFKLIALVWAYIISFLILGYVLNQYAPDGVRFAMHLLIQVWCSLVGGVFFEDASCAL